MERRLLARVNALLVTCAKNGRDATPIRLQKLLYFNYIVHLQQTDCQQLDYLEFEAWTYGPVIPTVYDYYKKLGYYSNDIIKKKMGENSNYPVVNDATIRQTVKKYGRLDTFELIDLAHKEGGAWYKAFFNGEHNAVIKHEDIIEEFCK